MSKYEELKYVLSGATDWGYEYAKKEDVEAAFAELEERHAMELDQWVLELGKMKRENERLKKDIDTLKTAWEQSQSALSTISALKLAAEEKHRASRMAFWLAMAELCRRLDVDRYLRNHRNSRYNENCLTWADACVAMEVKMCKAESKCRAKAEEYKTTATR